ncbi:MAG: hypothetical protein M1827_002929 [Pycnora praestabilis]|nr:MAG: hypothetical protein M1827_002929 [Pycnora praestabilis]
MAEIQNGLGRHEYYLTPIQRKRFRKFGWVDWMQTFLNLMFTKIAICLFLLRIMSSKWLVRTMYSLIGILVVFHAICVFLFLGVCRPLSAYWDPDVEGKCLSDHQVEYIIIAQGAFSVVTDLICATFPILILWTVKINLRTKVALCVLMGAGVIPEVNIGIVCANAPLFRPIYLYLRGRLPTQQAATSQASASTGRGRLHAHKISGGSRDVEQGNLTNKSAEMDLPIQLNLAEAKMDMGGVGGVIPEHVHHHGHEGSKTYLSLSESGRSGSSAAFNGEGRIVEDRF